MAEDQNPHSSKHVANNDEPDCSVSGRIMHLILPFSVCRNACVFVVRTSFPSFTEILIIHQLASIKSVVFAVSLAKLLCVFTAFCPVYDRMGTIYSVSQGCSKHNM